MVRVKKLLRSRILWASVLASTATMVVFVTYLQGSRNLLNVIGLEVPEPRVVFWSATSLVLLILLRIAGAGTFRRLPLSNSMVILILMPVLLISLRLIDKIASGGNAFEVNELIALVGLVLATALIGPMAAQQYIRLFWFVLIVTLAIFLLIALLRGPQGPDQYFDALSVGRIIFARYMAIGAVVTIYFSFKYSNWWLLFLGFAFILGTFLAGSRGGVLSLVCVGFVAFVFMKERLKLLAFAGASIVGLGILTFGPWPLQVLRIRYIDLSPTYTAGRDVIWSKKIDVISEEPNNLITGVSATESTDSHNFFLDAVLNGGVILIALTLCILVFWFIFVFRNRKILDETSLPVLLLVLVLVGSQFSGTFFENSLIWFFFVLVVLQIAVLKINGQVLRPKEQLPKTNILSKTRSLSI